MLTRLDRYLLREVAQTFVAVTGVLLVILLSNQLARVLGQAAQSDFPGSVVLSLIGLTTLQQLTVLVPIGLDAEQVMNFSPSLSPPIGTGVAEAVNPLR